MKLFFAHRGAVLTLWCRDVMPLVVKSCTTDGQKKGRSSEMPKALWRGPALNYPFAWSLSQYASNRPNSWSSIKRTLKVKWNSLFWELRVPSSAAEAAASFHSRSTELNILHCMGIRIEKRERRKVWQDLTHTWGVTLLSVKSFGLLSQSFSGDSNSLHPPADYHLVALQKK